MLLYNVTVNIEQDIEMEWVAWMKETHIPDVMATEMFFDYKIFKILHDNEDGSVNYSVQYFSENMEKLMNYQNKFSHKLQTDVKHKFQDKCLAFRTLLESVD